MNNNKNKIIIIVIIYFVAVSLIAIYDYNSQIEQDQNVKDAQQPATNTMAIFDKATTTNEVKDTEEQGVESGIDSGWNSYINNSSRDINTENYDAEEGYINFKIREYERELDSLVQEAERKADDELGRMEQILMDDLERKYIDRVTDEAIDIMIGNY